MQFAAGLNRLDFNLIGPLLALDCTYGSQTIFDTLEGHEEVTRYWSGKLEALEAKGDSADVSAELALEPLNGHPCVLLYQRRSGFGDQGLGEKLAYLTVKTHGGEKISELFMVSAAPSPTACRTTGIFPGRSAEEIRATEEFEGHRIPLSEEIVFALFVMDEVPLCQAMERAMKEVMPEPVRKRSRAANLHSFPGCNQQSHCSTRS